MQRRRPATVGALSSIFGGGLALWRKRNGGIARPSSDTSPDESEEFGSEGYARDFQLGLIENEDEMLQQVREALERIDRGEYGMCEACEEPIPPRRLEALPYARYCVACQTKAEDGTLGDD